MPAKLKLRPLAPKPRASRAKPKKTLTCPVCAERFKASRNDQRFCGATCRQRANRQSIPVSVQKLADAIRDRRIAAKAARDRYAEKRRVARARTRAHQERSALRSLLSVVACDASCFPHHNDRSPMVAWMLDQRKLERERENNLRSFGPTPPR